MIPSRRDVLRFGAFGAGTLLLPRWQLPRAASPADADPHFFLLVVLNGGADSSYMFDARPLSMTQGRQDPELPRQGARSLDRQERRQGARHLAHQAAGAVPRPLQRAQRRVHGAELRRPSAEHELPVRRQAVRRRQFRPASQLSPRPAASRSRSTPSSRPTRCSSTSTTIRAWSRCGPARSRRCRPRCAMSSRRSSDHGLVDFMRRRLAANAGDAGASRPAPV